MDRRKVVNENENDGQEREREGENVATDKDISTARILFIGIVFFICWRVHSHNDVPFYNVQCTHYSEQTATNVVAGRKSRSKVILKRTARFARVTKVHRFIEKSTRLYTLISQKILSIV